MRRTLFTLLFGIASITHADDTPIQSNVGDVDNEKGLILGLAVTTGGDELAQIGLSYNNGSSSTESIEAGGLLYFYGGVQSDRFVLPFRLTLGYFIDSVDASNGSVSFSRIPIEFTALHLSGPHTFGVGLTYHISPELDLSDAGLGTYKADDASGLVLMYEYAFDGDLSIGVRYTDISYDFAGGEVDGSNIGLAFTAKL